MECTFCSKVFKTKSNLTQHMKTAKYCLKLRGEAPSESSSYTCTDCGLIFTKKQNHEKHLRKCKGALGDLRQDKFDREVAELQKKLDEKDEVNAQQTEEFKEKLDEKDEVNAQQTEEFQETIDKKDDVILVLTYKVRDLETELKIYKSQSKEDRNALVDIAKRPTTTNTNNNNINSVILQLKPLDYSIENIEEMFRVMEPTALRNGQRGIAQHLIKEMFTTPDGDKKMICTDPSRDIFKYLDLDKKIAKDCKLYNLIEMCIEAGLDDKIHEFTRSINEQDISNTEKCILYQVAVECNGLRHNSSEFRSEFREQLTH